MILAIVREIDTKELVGFYAAPTIEKLRKLVSEVDYEYNCEYTEVENIGLYLSSPRPTVPIAPLPEDYRPSDEEGDEWQYYERMHLHIEFHPELARQLLKKDSEWKPLDWNAEHYRRRLREILETHQGRVQHIQTMRFAEKYHGASPQVTDEYAALVDIIEDHPNAGEIAFQFVDVSRTVH